jgi:hypothetical protein
MGLQRLLRCRLLVPMRLHEPPRRAPRSSVGGASPSVAHPPQGAAAAQPESWLMQDVLPSAPNLSSSLSPLASPFHPGDSSMGRSKAHRWADEDSKADRSPVSSPTSYHDAVHLGSQLRTSPLLEHAMPHLTG